MSMMESLGFPSSSQKSLQACAKYCITQAKGQVIWEVLAGIFLPEPSFTKKQYFNKIQNILFKPVTEFKVVFQYFV